jgi:hypothetical protein
MCLLLQCTFPTLEDYNAIHLWPHVRYAQAGHGRMFVRNMRSAWLGRWKFVYLEEY